MNPQNILLTEKFYTADFNQQLAQSISLFIEIDEQNLCLVATNDSSKNILAIEHYSIPQNFSFNNQEIIQQLHQQIEWLKSSTIKDLTASVCNTDFQLLPNEFNWLENKGGWQCVDVQSAINGKIVYEISGGVNNALRLFSNNLKFKHSLTGLLNEAIDMKIVFEKAVLCNFHQHAFDMILWNGEQIKLVNTFQMKTPEDVIYFLQLAMNQYQLNPLSDWVLLGGEIVQQSLLFSNLSKFFKQIEFAKRRKDFLQGVFKNILPHRFLTISGNIS
jgi:Protein of unknown function (DUF3822)